MQYVACSFLGLSIEQANKLTCKISGRLVGEYFRVGFVGCFSDVCSEPCQAPGDAGRPAAEGSAAAWLCAKRCTCVDAKA